MGEARRRKLAGTYPTVGVPWPQGLPEAEKARARKAAEMANAGQSGVTITERLGVSEADVFGLILTGECLAADETGTLPDRLTALRDAVVRGARGR
jgi:hypothetical protein